MSDGAALALFCMSIAESVTVPFLVRKKIIICIFINQYLRYGSFGARIITEVVTVIVMCFYLRVWTGSRLELRSHQVGLATRWAQL